MTEGCISRIEIALAVENWRGEAAELFGAGHGLLLKLLAQADPTTAQAIHDAAVRKPLALSPLRVQPSKGDLAQATLEVAVWEPALAASILHGCSLALDLRAQVLGHPAVVLDSKLLAETSLSGLLQGGGSARVAFKTPTFFSFGRSPAGRQRYGLLPQAELVVGSWLRAWQQAGGESFGAQPSTDWLMERVELRTHTNLRTRTVHTNHIALTGFLGEASYEWVGGEEWGPCLLRALAAFSIYCGTGAKTGYGFGHTSNQ